MKTNKETVLASDALSPEGRMMAKCLIKKDGVSIERLFNLLGEFQSEIVVLQRQVDDVHYDIKYHSHGHD